MRLYTFWSVPRLYPWPVRTAASSHAVHSASLTVRHTLHVRFFVREGHPPPCLPMDHDITPLLTGTIYYSRLTISRPTRTHHESECHRRLTTHIYIHVSSRHSHQTSPVATHTPSGASRFLIPLRDAFLVRSPLPLPVGMRPLLSPSLLHWRTCEGGSGLLSHRPLKWMQCTACPRDHTGKGGWRTLARNISRQARNGSPPSWPPCQLLLRQCLTPW